MKSNLEFIVFALKQAREAEEFGFTRNICSRNLKIALHRHWQHKILGMSGISNKLAIPRSRAAVGKDKSQTIVEHVVPMMVIVNMLMDHKRPTKKAVQVILEKYYYVRLITREEDATLRSSGLRSTMPEDWDGENIWARYEIVGIALEEW